MVHHRERQVAASGLGEGADWQHRLVRHHGVEEARPVQRQQREALPLHVLLLLARLCLPVELSRRRAVFAARTLQAVDIGAHPKLRLGR